MKLSKLFFLVICLSGCAVSEPKVVPGIVPNTVKEKEIIRIMPNNVIGEVEPVYLLPMKSPFMSRIDTGAANSSLDVEETKKFERDGRKWISFKVVNRETGETHVFEKPVIKIAKIKRIGNREERPLVEMEVKMGGEIFKAKFNIAEREKFEYQTLIGRNILTGRAIVDVSLNNTLK